MAPAKEKQMFNNLIESRSHTSEIKRRGSFFLYTIAAYGLLFVIAGVTSIYAYDAHLDEQDFQKITMLSPVDLPSPPKPDSPVGAPNRSPNREFKPDVRPEMIASINHPELPPALVSASPNPFLPVRDRHLTVGGGPQANGTDSPGPVGPGGSSSGGGHVVPPTIVADSVPPPAPAPTPAPIKILRTSRVLNGEALSLPKPVYSSIAKNAHAFGLVTVQILIDEKGHVISAHALGGNPLLSVEAVRAAYLARFSPTTVGDTPVKVSGVINYNFVMQ
jgi:hypothetical protein